MKSLLRNLQDLFRYPSAVAGLVLILSLVGLSIYTLITLPYAEAIRLWRGGEEVWYKNPKTAAPEWFNLFTKRKLPISFTLNSADGSAEKTVKPTSAGDTITLTYTFDYQYDDFPQEMIFYFQSEFNEKKPFADIVWKTPDGRSIRMAQLGLGPSETYRVSMDEKLKRILKGVNPVEGLFLYPGSDTPALLKGKYQAVVTVYTSEPNNKVDAEFVLHGKLAGWAGTDHQRRDIGVALLWGTPIALAFGLIAAIGTTFTTMIIAAFGVWYGGWLDELIQRITEVNMVLPFLPILIMIGYFYSRSIWLILGATILLSIFTGGIMTYRAMFLQVKEAPYVEAARSYGASDIRIVLRYLSPRLIPTLIPQLVTLIPTYVFIEASLAVVGLGDPVLPTWGKIINDAYVHGAPYQGQYYWVLEPSILLMVSGLGFALLGFALDRVFNPRLRGQ
jgi:peptide/nickel transport system permease protein